MAIRLSDLNPPQRQAVITTEGPLLVLAGAGSGKTRVITYRIAHLLEKGARPESILAVSFTNKAADEMRERVDRLCTGGQARGVMLSTFHALGLVILKSEQAALGMATGFSVYDTSDQLGVIREILRHAHMEGRKLETKSILSRISRAKNAGLSPQDFVSQVRKARFVSEYDGFTAEVYPRYVERMRALHALDFDDLLVETLRVLRENEQVAGRWQSRFRYLMIDEYQDTNHCQLELLRLLCKKHGNLAVVGDDDQSIYAWRGADSRNILQFEKQFPGASVIKLEENYRSTGGILAAANAVIEKNTARHGKTLWTQRGAGDPIQLVIAPGEDEEAQFVAEEIDSLVMAGKCDLRDIAVLYRTTRQCEPIETALRSARIEYHVIGGQAFFDRKEVKDAMAYLKLITYPHDELALRRVINYPPRGIGPQAMDGLSALHKESRRKRPDTSLWEVVRDLVSHKTGSLDLFASEESAPEHEGLSSRIMISLQRFVRAIEKYQKLYAQLGGGKLKEVAEELLREVGVQDDLVRAGPTMAQSERRLRNLSEFLASMQRYAEKAGPDFDMLSYLNRLTLSSQDEDADDSLRDAVTLSTLHGAKGLEWKVVFFVGLEEEILPHKRSLAPRQADHTIASRRLSEGEGDDPEGDPHSSDLSEERRLCYVGITRARQKLYISRAEMRGGWPKNPSRFLDDIPPNLLIVRDLEGPPPKQDPQDEEAFVKALIAQSLSVSE